jgi:ElaB/YqjD/DUF883 family membrane-anchored ribosome-binding protein
MPLSDIVNRVKGMLTGNKAGTDPGMNVAGSGQETAGDTFASFKEKATDLAEKAQDEASHLAEKAKEEASRVADQAQDVASDLKHKAEDLIDRGKDTMDEAASHAPDGGKAHDKVEEAKDLARDHAAKAQSDVTDRVDELKTSAEAHVEHAESAFEEKRS